MVCPYVGTAAQECHLSGMLPTGRLSGQDEPYKPELCPLSPKRGDLQKNSDLGQSLCRNMQTALPQGSSLHGLSLMDTKAKLSPSRFCSSDGQEGIGVLKDNEPKLTDRIKDEEEEEEMEGEQGSTNIVEHILKELKGINKIQEEISDLRQYLTSVRGSVDEVSCCVDAVLNEIGELYSGGAAAPHPSPVSQTTRIRRGSLGRQNAITSLYAECLSPQRTVGQWQVYKVQSAQQTDQEDVEQVLSSAKSDLCYLKLQGSHGCQSTSSLSSCISPEAGFLSGDAEQWPSVSMQNSISGEGGWSEEDLCSCANSAEELENCSTVWDRCTTEETESSTPGHSSHNSSEHLSLLFGPHYNSPSSSSSVVGWRPQRLQTEGENLGCHCAADCPYSRSSGYHTVDACPNELRSEPSRSLSRSTVLLTDCDDGYLEPLCDDRPSSVDTLDLGSADSLDVEWTDFRDEAGESLSQVSSEMDPDNAETTSNVGFDVTTFSKAVLTFRSALRGALKKLEGTNPEDFEEDCGCVRSSSPVRQTSVQEQSSAEDTETSWTANLSPREGDGALVSMETPEDLPCSLQPSPHDLCIPTECRPVEVSQGGREFPTEQDLSNSASTPEQCAERPTESPVAPGHSADEVRLSPIRENQILDEVKEGRPTDAGHRERIANFQRILREKRQTRHRMSRSGQGSQGSHGSQGSQGSQSQDEVMAGIAPNVFLHLLLSLFGQNMLLQRIPNSSVMFLSLQSFGEKRLRLQTKLPSSSKQAFIFSVVVVGLSKALFASDANAAGHYSGRYVILIENIIFQMILSDRFFVGVSFMLLL